MKDPGSSIRYLGHRTLPDGGRGFHFSFGVEGVNAASVTIDAAIVCFRGPDSIGIQEGPGICFETLRCRLNDGEAQPPTHFALTANDIALHRKSGKNLKR